MRKVFIFLFLAAVPVIWNPVCGQSPSEGIGHPQTSQGRPRKTAQQSRPDQIGTKARPLVVDTEGHVQTSVESADARAKADRENDVARRTLDAAENGARYADSTPWATWALVAVGIGGIWAAPRNLDALKAQIREMQASTRQT